MKSKLLILIATLAVLLTGCDKAPDGIIKESDLADFLYDLYRLEAIIDMNPEAFPSDSVKRVAKQSLFQKHGITQAEYDSSLVWYATNFEAYNTVHKKVMMRLQDDNKELTAEMANAPQEHKSAADDAQKHKMYAAKGDTADIWNDDRSLMLTAGLKRGYFAFDFDPDGEHRKGDKYLLGMKMLSFNNTFGLMLAAEYADGTVSIASRNASLNGWTELALQTDSTRNVRRIFGYIHYNVASHSVVAFLDSISLVRTHLDRKIYTNINSQKFVSRNQSMAAAQKSGSPAKGGPDKVKSAPQQKLYAPKPGVNKGGVVHRVPLKK